jgi:hypothetical protein
MSGTKQQHEQNEQHDEVRDLDVPEQDAEDVKGGVSGEHFPEVVLTPKSPPKR